MKIGMVLEGGGMRGMYTAGILDVMLENEIKIDGIVGVSAGTVFGCNYKSRQIGRTIRYNKKYCKGSDYIELEKIDNSISLDNITNKVNELQEKFLDSKVGKAIDLGIDAGIKVICPNLIENQVIEVKDALLENGLEGGIKEIVESVKDFGKSTLGLITGNFESIEQIEMAVKNGGVIDILSGVLDLAIECAEKKGLIEKNIAKAIKKGKNTMLKSFSKNISQDLLKEQKSLEKVEGYINEWKKYYESNDFNNMEKMYKKIEKQINKIAPIKNVIKDSQIIENIHNIIKNNDRKFNLSEEELELAKKLF